MKKQLTIIALAALLFASCDKKNDTVTPEETSGKATITFDAVVGASDFALNKDFTVGTKTWNFSQLRYWVSNVVLVKASGEEVAVPNSYYLIEENVAVPTNSDFVYPANKRETVTIGDIPTGDYKSIKFSVGVPEKYNNNLSLQAGELSQLNGMTNISWMWATSYIFSSLKGSVKEGTVSKAIAVETGLNANFKTVSLSLPATLHIGSNKATSILLNADVTKITDGVDIMATPSVGASQATVMSAVATNYSSKVFTVKSAQ
ncbi:MbnP family protein [Pedobacter sp. ASV12]|uniref:MbnP family protein n=1 Tax=Pedobacter sp. ASV12 TaxID=2795120 RepID=UPI0018EB4AEF|nr:MbnP family protein [Pedobacter sp. ASV12]